MTNKSTTLILGRSVPMRMLRSKPAAVSTIATVTVEGVGLVSLVLLMLLLLSDSVDIVISIPSLI